ncbi:MAG TPA: hypothetical protein VGF67_09085 [Ktedonobacteraceae bacterium]
MSEGQRTHEELEKPAPQESSAAPPASAPRRALKLSATPTSLNAAIETSLIILGLLAVFFLLPREMKGDGLLRYQALLHILINHSIPESRYSLIGPFFALPLIWIGRKLGDPSGWALVYNQVLFAASILLSYFLLKDQMQRAILRKFYLLLLIASMFVAHLAFFYGEVFTALTVGFGLLFVYLRTAALPGWLLLALGVANSPAAIGGLVPLALKRVLDNKRLRYGLIVIAALALAGLNNWLQHGNPFNPGYGDDVGFKTVMPYSGLPGFSYPILFGLLSILLSFGKGLFFFAPGLLLPVRQTLLRHRESNRLPLFQVYLLWIAFLAGLVLVYAHWWGWYGGVFWGPRFFLFAAIPASFALAIRLLYARESSLAVNGLTLVVFMLSVWVCIDGAVYQWSTSLFATMPAVCTQNHFNLEMLCYYTPEFSALWLPFVKHITLDFPKTLFLIYVLLAAVYLGLPLGVQVGCQVGQLLRRLGRPLFSLHEWRI